MTLYIVRQTVWIQGGLALAKQAIHKCKPCIRQDARLLQPEMGDLPFERVVKSFTFSNTGLDYCGPFYIRDNSSQKIKVYVAIFICFATKVLHMETVNSLTKDNCLDAVKPFCATRGLPKAFYSDNSMTFIGSQGEIEFQKLMTNKEFKEIFSASPTTTQFHGTLLHQKRHTSEVYGKRQ